LSASVEVAFDDQFAAGADEAVDGGLGQERVSHHGQPAVRTDADPGRRKAE
jgi:hypothetical protein